MGTTGLVRLSGVVDFAMNNFLCLRGCAPMLKLANVSETMEGIQRDLITEHAGEMKSFLKSGKFTFFPEVILGVDLEANGVQREQYALFLEGAGKRKILKSTKIGNFTVSISNYERHKGGKTIATLQSAFIKFYKDEIKNFLRIDGNHRLSAVDDDSSYEDTPIPFCLLFFYGAEDTDKFCRALFHNINTNSIKNGRESKSHY